LQHTRTSTTSRYVALVAVLTALYSIYGFVSGVELRPFTQSLDLFFLLPVFFAILVSLTGKKWSSTLLATIIGLLFAYPTAGVPFPWHITVSLIVNGLVFDIYLQESKIDLYEIPKRQLITAGALGNFGMAIAGLLVFQIFIGPQATILWVLKPMGDTFVGALGGLFGWMVIERVRGIRTRRLLEAKSAVKVRA
jgi:hypothetical protein